MTVYPKDARLHIGVSAVLELEQEQLVISSRRPNSFSSTFPSEVVTCCVDNKTELKVLCKYSGNHNHHAFGHRGGINYEVEVYRDLLGNIGMTVPHCYGIYSEIERNNDWLILEFLENSRRITQSSDPDATLKAARWIGNFHAACGSIVTDVNEEFLRKYDSDYYMGWAERTLSFTRSLDGSHKWLEALMCNFSDVIDILSEAPITVIHGEYYPDNILLREGLIYPVDWESAALAAGEIDIAALSDGWGEEYMRKLESEYILARWPHGTTYDHRRVICAARIYLYLRRLGERPEKTAKRIGVLGKLRRSAEIFGIV